MNSTTSFSGYCPETLYKLWRQTHDDSSNVNDEFAATFAERIHRELDMDRLDPEQRELVREHLPESTGGEQWAHD
jgi:hypothetical protein